MDADGRRGEMKGNDGSRVTITVKECDPAAGRATYDFAGKTRKGTAFTGTMFTGIMICRVVEAELTCGQLGIRVRKEWVAADAVDGHTCNEWPWKQWVLYPWKQWDTMDQNSTKR